jgi:hypothetical protein
MIRRSGIATDLECWGVSGRSATRFRGSGRGMDTGRATGNWNRLELTAMSQTVGHVVLKPCISSASQPGFTRLDQYTSQLLTPSMDITRRSQY